jgi:hypothetical protein
VIARVVANPTSAEALEGAAELAHEDGTPREQELIDDVIAAEQRAQRGDGGLVERVVVVVPGEGLERRAGHALVVIAELGAVVHHPQTLGEEGEILPVAEALGRSVVRRSELLSPADPGRDVPAALVEEQAIVEPEIAVVTIVADARQRDERGAEARLDRRFIGRIFGAERGAEGVVRRSRSQPAREVGRDEVQQIAADRRGHGDRALERHLACSAASTNGVRRGNASRPTRDDGRVTATIDVDERRRGSGAREANRVMGSGG